MALVLDCRRNIVGSNFELEFADDGLLSGCRDGWKLIQKRLKLVHHLVPNRLQRARCLLGGGVGGGGRRVCVRACVCVCVCVSGEGV